MAEYEQLAERIISGKGVLKVPDIDESYRVLLMCVDVIRRPRNLYESYDWNPAKGMYARMAFRRDKYVVFDSKIEYERQVFDYILDPSGQTLIAVKCAYEGILQSFVNLVNGMAGTPGGVGIFVTGVTDLIKDYENLDMTWDEVLFKCYSSTALQVRFFGLKYDTCDPLKDKKRRPPPPPPPLPEVPPDTPIENITPPYSDDEDEDTQPFPGDYPLELPFGLPCQEYDVVLAWNNLDGRTGTGTFRLFGEIEGAGVGGDGTFVFVSCRGGAASVDPPAGECLAEITDCAVLGSTEPDYANVSITSITAV